MELKWTRKALSDLARLHEFLAPVNKRAAARLDRGASYDSRGDSPARTAQSLIAAPAGLLAHPRIGEKLEEFEPRDVRRILVGHYEIRYEIRGSTLYVLRLWHTREER